MRTFIVRSFIRIEERGSERVTNQLICDAWQQTDYSLKKERVEARKKTQEIKVMPLKWKIFIVVLVAAFFIAATVLLFSLGPQQVHFDFIAVRGRIYELKNETETPLFNVTIIAITDEENAVKGFTNETGDFEVWVKYPENLSRLVWVYALKRGYVECWKNQSMPAIVLCVKETQAYTVWGYVTFDPILLVKETET